MNITTDFGMFYGKKNYQIRNREMTKTMERLSSGLSVNSASDNVGNIGSIERKTAIVKSTSKANENIKQGIDLMETASSALKQVINILQRMRELAIQADNDTVSDADRTSLSNEFNDLKNSISQLANSSQYGNIKVLQPPINAELQTLDGKADIVFVVDNSGSMDPIQLTVANNIVDFVKKLNDQGVTGVNVGVLEYTDRYYPKIMGGSLWTSDPAQVASVMDQMSRTTGSGTENLMTALETVMNNYNFRENEPGTVVRHVVFLTDEDADDEGKLTETVTKLQTMGIQVHGIFQTGAADAGELRSVVSSTGGESIKITAPDWGQQLIDKVGGKIALSANDGLGVTLHVGDGAEDDYSIKMLDGSPNKLGIDTAFINDKSTISTAIEKIDEVIGIVSDYMSDYGASENRLKYMVDNNESYKINTESSLSKVEDADMALEMSKLIKLKTLDNSSFLVQKESMNLGEYFVDMLLDKI